MMDHFRIPPLVSYRRTFTSNNEVIDIGVCRFSCGEITIQNAQIALQIDLINESVLRFGDVTLKVSIAAIFDAITSTSPGF